MAHLITSHKGADHVESKHAAHWNAGTLGNGCYVLPIRQQARLHHDRLQHPARAVGVGSVCGYDWEIEGDYEEVDIDQRGARITTASTCSWRASRRRLQKRWS